MNFSRWHRAFLTIFVALAIGCFSLPVQAQTVVGPETSSSRFNRLRDIAVRPMTANAPADPDVFGTAAVSAGVTFYDARFRRVSLADRNDPAVLAIADKLRGLDPAAQIATVQREVLSRVKFAPRSTLSAPSTVQLFWLVRPPLSEKLTALDWPESGFDTPT